MIHASLSDPNTNPKLHPGPHLNPLAVLLTHLQTLSSGPFLIP